MAIEWFGYCLLISGLLGLGALAGERALTHYRRPVRWVWAGAIAGSVLLPLGAFFLPALIEALSPIAPPLSGPVAGIPLDLSGASGAEGLTLASVLEAASTGMVWLWALSIAALAGYMAAAYRRLKAEMREWTPSTVLEAPVLLSEDRGPAVVGVRKGVIVMPRWIAELEENVLRLVFLHEREHQRAGDQRLFAVALATLLATPWNPILWWEVRRLRLAIEYDCDHRVMAQGVDPREYADALLTVGSRASSAPLAAAAFAERRSAVERRLRRMTAPLRRLRGPRAVLAAGLGIVALALACGSPFPTETTPDPAVDVVAVDDSADPSARPTFLPYDDPPKLANGEVVQKAMREVERPEWSGRAEVWLYIDENGRVGNQSIKTSSGDPALDEAAARVSALMEFEPASNKGTPTAVWVSQFVSFGDPPAPKRVPSMTARQVPLELDEETAGHLKRAVESLERVRVGEEGAPPVALERDEGLDMSTLVPAREAEAVFEAKPVPGGTLKRMPAPPTATARFDEERATRAILEVQEATQGAPLIVVDGVVREGWSLEDLKAQDIAAVEIVKGAAARELYGSRAANGVVHVTTLNAVGSGAAPAPPVSRLERRPSRDEGVVRLEELMVGDDASEPLIIVDGVIQNAGLDELGLRPERIDHIEIVKGAAAESLYGSRAANGVIRITTKDGG